MHFDIVGLLFAVAVCAGIVDGVAGGGGLITLPVLMIAGLPPAQALATNKIQALASVASSAHRFTRAGIVNLPSMKWKVLVSAIGAGVGAYLVRIVDSSILGKIAPVLLICIALFFMLSRNLTKHQRRKRVSEGLFTLAAVLPIAFYDGFFGPGTGTIYVAAFVLLLGRNLPQATAETKVLNATGSAIAAIIFLPGGFIAWPAALAMSAGGIIGGQIGAMLAIRWGSSFIRVALVMVSIALAVRLLFQYQDFLRF